MNSTLKTILGQVAVVFAIAAMGLFLGYVMAYDKALKQARAEFEGTLATLAAKGATK